MSGLSRPRKPYWFIVITLVLLFRGQGEKCFVFRSDKGRLERPIVTRPGRFSVNLLGLSRVIREDFLRRINRDAV